MSVCEPTAGAGDIFLVLVAATNIAKKKIEKETSLQFITGKTLTDRDNLFSYKCSHFTADEQHTSLDYCTKADKKNLKGNGGSGLLVVSNNGCQITRYQWLYQKQSWRPS
jgi:hypothetical protein